MGRVLPAFYQFFADDGSPLAKGWLRFLESGSNNTDKNTYVDENLSIPNANPLQLDAAGRMPDAFGTGKYRVVSFINDPEDFDSPGEQIQTKDPVIAESSGAGGGQAGFESWDNATTYQLNDIVLQSGSLYRSLIVDNLNNNPTFEEFAWEQIDFLRYWNETITYSAGDLVYYGSNLYLASQDGNINFNPESRYDYWRPVATGVIGVEFKTDDYEIFLTERDYMFALDSTTLADKQFTLPLMTSSYDGFTVWACNASDFNLSITPQGTASIWLEDPVIIEKGAILKLRYCSTRDTWQTTGNAGSVLGGQNLGTTTNPIQTAYVNDLELLSSLNIGDDIPLYLGADNDAELVFTSAAPALDLKLITGTDFNINVNSVLHWTFDAAGPILPGASNPNASIGSSSEYINDCFFTDVNIDGQLYFNPANDLLITHSSLAGFMTCYSGDLTITALDVGTTLNLSTAGGTAASFDDALAGTFFGDILFSQDVYLGDNDHIYMGGAQDLDIYHDGSAIAYFTSNSTFRFYSGATPTLAMLIGSNQDVNFYNDIRMEGTDPRIYLEPTNTWIGASTAGNILYLTGDIVAIFVNSILMQINLIATGVSGTSTEAAYFRANIGGTNYYFKGYT